MPNEPLPEFHRPSKFHPHEFENTVVVIYMSPGPPVDGAGFAIIVAIDKNGNQVLKRVPIGPGPGDPPWIIQASAYWQALDGVAGVEELRTRTAEAIQLQVQSLVRAQIEAPIQAV